MRSMTNRAIEFTRHDTSVNRFLFTIVASKSANNYHSEVH